MDDGRVRGTSSVMIWAVEASAHPDLSFIGDFEDIYVKHQRGQWLIHERRIVPMVALGG